MSRIACDICQLDPDGRCAACSRLLVVFLKELVDLQVELGRNVESAIRCLEEGTRTLVDRFKGEPHQCYDCQKSSTDASLAVILEGFVKSFSALRTPLPASVHGDLKLAAKRLGLTETPILDKAWRDIRKAQTE